jgi:hypothetical protein
MLYILAMDQESIDLLNNENIDNISIITLSQIESFYPELTEIKKTRSRAEYCWTLTSYSIQYAIKKYSLNSCTYLDADIYFFNDPKILFDEAGNSSIIITEHRYTVESYQTKKFGKYCVQFVYFKNDKYGMEALEWWRQRCREWCYSKYEDGKFGDQKYLDDWTTRFEGVFVPTHIGCGLAPWNIQQFDIIIEDGKLFSHDKITKKKEPVIFYHFHQLKKIYADIDKIIWRLTIDKPYVIDNIVKEYIYTDYLRFISRYEENYKGSLREIKKPAFFSIIYLIIKDIIKSLLFFKKFKYYKEYLNNEYNKICTVLR